VFRPGDAIGGVAVVPDAQVEKFVVCQWARPPPFENDGGGIIELLDRATGSSEWVTGEPARQFAR
ncbi:MAG: hypothetical protein ABI700_26965, partial [Chloroflexota bacterium]